MPGPVLDEEVNNHLLKECLDSKARWGTTVSGDLDQFSWKYTQLMTRAGARSSDYGPHTRFALTAQYDKGDAHFRMKLEPQGQLSVPRVEQIWDVDSVLVFLDEDDDFPMEEGTLYYTPMNNTEFTLVSSLHIPPMQVRGATTLTGAWVEPHLMPNALFGFIAGQGCPKILVRLLFPRLAGKLGALGNHISKERMQELYDRLVLRAVLLVLPRHLHAAWPISWLCEQFRATRRTGQLVQTPYNLPAEYITRVFKAMYNATREDPELGDYRDFIVQLQLQGTKHSAHHGPLPLDHPADDVRYWIQAQREEALRLSILPLEIMMLPPGKTYVDVAVVLHLADRGFSLLPKTEQHAWLTSAVTGISVVDAAERITAGSKAGMFLDEFAHTGCYAGFRLTLKPEAQPSPLGVVYLQVYTSDRNLTALKDGNYFAKHTEARRVIQNFPHELEHHYTRLIGSYQLAREQETPIDTRVEVRTLLWNIFKVMQPLPGSTLRNCLAPVKSKAAWHWKEFRAESSTTVLGKLWVDLPSVDSDHIHAPLTLLCAAVWLGNSTVNRPDDGPEFKIMADTVTVHKIRHGVPVAIRPWTAMQLHSWREQPMLRVSSHRVMGTETLARLLQIRGTDPEAELLRLVYRRREEREEEDPLPVWGTGENFTEHATGSKRTLDAPIPTRRQRVRIDRPQGADVIPEEEPRIPEPAAGRGYASEEEDHEQLPKRPRNRDVVNRIFKEMAGGLLLKCCTLKQQHCRKISEYQCSRETFATLEDSRELPRVLACWRQVTRLDLWEKSVTKILPDRKRAVEIKKDREGKKKKTYLQGLAQLAFYQDWEEVMTSKQLSDKDKDELVEYARSELRRRAGWLPVGAADRLWSDDSAGKAKTHGTPENGNRGTVVVLNPAMGGEADIPGGFS
ncbi:hypothetical protein FRC07_002882 [Ceratobasidium sp. 392]|nr:hypothetical protein FRC07_002882 [Ceratobasidium sp. 392]